MRSPPPTSRSSTSISARRGATGGGRRQDGARFYDVFLTTYPFSFTGLPIVSLPSGTTAAGLPVGVQVRGVAPARGSGHRGGGRLCGTSSGPLPASRRRQEPGSSGPDDLADPGHGDALTHDACLVLATFSKAVWRRDSGSSGRVLGTLRLPAPSPWRINAGQGRVTVPPSSTRRRLCGLGA